MAYWIVRQEIEHLDLDVYSKKAAALIKSLTSQVGRYYLTHCPICKGKNAVVKYFLWAKTAICQNCQRENDLLPGLLVASNRRHTRYVVFCPNCRSIEEIDDLQKPGHCSKCGKTLSTKGNAARNRFTCIHCNNTNTYPQPKYGPPRHRMFAIEYHCDHCAPQHKGRFFKAPDRNDLDLK
jgi:putative DNA methylase